MMIIKSPNEVISYINKTSKQSSSNSSIETNLGSLTSFEALSNVQKSTSVCFDFRIIE